MATQKPISTISYNSEPFLKETLEKLMKAHIIQNYIYIKHKGEDGDKDHIHLRIEPNKAIDKMTLQEEFTEYVKESDKPLRVRPFRPSKEEDWILYAVHDKDYLRIKYGGGEKGEKLPYELEDFVFPDNYDMDIAFIRAKASIAHMTENVLSRLKSGEDSVKMVLMGENPYVVNSLMNLLNKNEYSRVVQQLEEANEEISRLKRAILDAGLILSVDEEGNYFIEADKIIP